MKKIGILTCARSNDVCTRAGCLNAFNERKDFFRDYGQDVRLGVLMTCNGCRRDTPEQPSEDEKMKEKVERLRKEEIDVVHVGVCRMHGGKECPRITEICTMIENQGIAVIRGTHREG